MNFFHRLLRVIANNVEDSLTIAILFPLRHLAAFAGMDFRVRIGATAIFHLRRNTSDAAVIRQVFRYREYDISHLPQWSEVIEKYQSILQSGKTPVIIDAGANIGAASVWFSDRFPKAAVLAIEPDMENARQFRLNTSQAPRVKLFEQAVGSTSGNVSLSNPTEEAWAVQTRRGTDSTVGISIITIPELVESIHDGHLFIVKIDIEGFESDLFAADISWAKTAKVIYIEPHDWMASARRSSRAFQQVLAPLGMELLVCGENLVFVQC